MTESEISLLSKGLKFVPKPSKPNSDDVTQSIADFSRRIKLTEFFSNNKFKNTETEKKLFVPKSNWVPPDKFIRNDILDELKSLEESISNINLRQNNEISNLNKDELKALKSLKNNKTIVIKPADKGSTTVIMDREDYIKEGNRQLANVEHYRKIDNPIYPNVSQEINDNLGKMKDQKRIDKKQFDYLKVPNEPRDRKFYLLPKIHKERDKWSENGKIPPGRPIVSDCGSDTYRLSEYIDHFLYPLATTHDSYIRDTPDFLEKVSNVKTNPDSLLITLDVDSLYTNIDNLDGLKAVDEAFQNNPNDNRPNQEILNLLSISLKNNDFVFDNEWYLQIGGTAMGKKFAPNYANLFLAKWEKEALDKCPKKPQCYFRYLDDIFIVWPHSREDFDNFFQILNSHHNNIKLKSTISDTSVDFLDVTIFKGPNLPQTGSLDTKVFFKPTDTHELLHKSSYHPKHTFKGIVKSQIIRFHRICSSKSDFDNACKTLFSAIKQRGYASSFLRKIKRDTIQSLNSKGQSTKCGKKNCKTCPHLLETSIIKHSKNKTICLQENLNCRSEGVIYLIQCSNCDMKYVGETSRKLHERLTDHRSDINTNKTTPVASHFNDICPSIDYLKIVPIEHVPRKITDTFMGLLDKIDLLTLLQREQFWIRKLNTMTPYGLNKRNELPPPIPFSTKFSDQAGEINTLVKTFYDKIQLNKFGTFRKYQFVSAYKRNKNIKDHLVSASLKEN